MDASTHARDGREIAVEHETAVLRSLGRFGWLTARQLARVVWPGKSQGQRMAQRTLARLVGAGAVLRRTLPTGGVAYVLGQRGARRLRELGDETVHSRGFRDLRFHAPLHRAIANHYAIDRLTTSRARVYTEIQIQRGIAPQLHLPFRGRERIPDLLIDVDGAHEWVEVERAAKSRGRLDTLTAFAHYLLAPSPEATRGDLLVKGGEVVGYVDRVRFVCWSDANVRACVRAFVRFGMERLLEDCPYQLILERVDMSAGMVWGGSRGELSVEALAAQLVDDRTAECPARFLDTA